MAENYHVVEDVVDAEGWIVQGGYSAWNCEKCKKEVRRYRGQRSANCECGASYSPSGQRFRDDWADNPSYRYGDCGDLEGFERQHAGDS